MGLFNKLKKDLTESKESKKQSVDINPQLQKLDMPLEYKIAISKTHPGKLFNAKKEFKKLPDVIDINNENIIYICTAFWDGTSGLFICTNKRLVFLNQHFLVGSDQTVIPLNVINGVSYNQQLLSNSISITNGANTTIVEGIMKGEAPKMVKKIQDAINSLKAKTTSPSSDSLDQIKKLKELLDMDAITQEEFDAKKKQLLNL